MRFLLLPGMDGTGQLFARLSRALPKDAQIDVVSYPSDEVVRYRELVGHVQSRLHTARAEETVIVAESFSGPIAILLAARMPQLRALVLVATFARAPVPSVARAFARESFFSITPPRAAVRTFMVGRDADPDLVQEVRDAIARPAPRVMAARLRETLSMDVTRELAALAMPTLVLRPTQDRLVRRPLTPANVNTTLARVRGPHLLLQRHPRRCAELIHAFLNR